MGLFNFFRKKPASETSENGVAGPVYLENYCEHISNPTKLKPYEWRRRLTHDGTDKFKIRYYGQLQPKLKQYIVGTEKFMSFVIAEHVNSNLQIVLWDGCKHGYNAIFYGDFSEEQIAERVADKLYVDAFGKDIFQIGIAAYYQNDLKKEIVDETDEEGNIQLDNGVFINAEEALRNAFDFISISIINDQGQRSEILCEELA